MFFMALARTTTIFALLSMQIQVQHLMIFLVRFRSLIASSRRTSPVSPLLQTRLAATLVLDKMILAHDKKIVVLARKIVPAMMTAVKIIAHVKMIAGAKTIATPIVVAKMTVTIVVVRMIVVVRIIVDAKIIMKTVPAAMMMSVVATTTVVGVVTASPPPTSTPHARYVTFMGILPVTAGGAMAMIVATMEVTKVPMLLLMV
jgi:hypothetical protein